MAQHVEYNCSECGKTKSRDELLAKKVSFVTLGAEGSMVRSRTIAWLCFGCVKADPQFNIEEYDSPGMRQDEAIKARYSTSQLATDSEGEGQQA